MSRLDSIMRRLSAQRDGLEWARDQTADLQGDALDMGLGNGRTYDHMREILPTRRIWVIDRVLQCHASCIPPDADFLQGEAEPMLARLAAQPVKIALAHYDFGFGDEAKDIAEAARLSPAVAAVMAPRGIIVSGQPLVGFTRVDGPPTIARDRYFLYQT